MPRLCQLLQEVGIVAVWFEEQYKDGHLIAVGSIPEAALRAAHHTSAEQLPLQFANNWCCRPSPHTWKKRRVSPPLQPGRSYATASRFSDSCRQADDGLRVTQ